MAEFKQSTNLFLWHKFLLIYHPSPMLRFALIVDHNSLLECKVQEGFILTASEYLMANMSIVTSTATLKQQSSFPKFYIDVLETRKQSENYTLIYLMALGKNYYPLLAEDACAALKSTSRPCVDADQITNGSAEYENETRIEPEDEADGLSAEDIILPAFIFVCSCVAVVVVGFVGFKYYRRMQERVSEFGKRGKGRHTITRKALKRVIQCCLLLFGPIIWNFLLKLVTHTNSLSKTSSFPYRP